MGRPAVVLGGGDAWPNDGTATMAWALKTAGITHRARLAVGELRTVHKLLDEMVEDEPSCATPRRSRSAVSPLPPRRPPAAGAAPREGAPGAPGSAVYRHALRFQRPTTVRWHEQLANSASFIGSVLFPLRRVSAGDGRFGVSTLLHVPTPRDSGRGFRISLKMWDEMAEISWKHLRPEDFVYVSGQLGSYEKASEGGQIRTYYEVIVKELNYVAQTCKDHCLPTSAESKSGALSEKRKDRLQLWQIFFANPYEWWDNRTSKMILHGFKDNWSCSIHEWEEMDYQGIIFPAVSLHGCMMSRNSPAALKQGLSLETMLYKQQIAIPLWKEDYSV
ncbi:hypothetical protein NL676_025789 [Syzygium grande]|nr:hypothetical protein NL676_025789 [Syzygium grande]